MQFAPCILFKQSHLINYSCVQPGNMSIFHAGLISETQRKYIFETQNIFECYGFHKIFRVLDRKLTVYRILTLNIYTNNWSCSIVTCIALRQNALFLIRSQQIIITDFALGMSSLKSFNGAALQFC